MKTTIKYITYINRLFEFTFLISILISFVVDDMRSFALLIAFFLGVYQILSTLITLINWKKITIKIRKHLIIYLCISFIYCYYTKLDLFGINRDFIYIIYSIPILLSIFISYQFEKMKALS